MDVLESNGFAAVWSHTSRTYTMLESGGHLIWIGNYTMDVLDPFQLHQGTQEREQGLWQLVKHWFFQTSYVYWTTKPTSSKEQFNEISEICCFWLFGGRSIWALCFWRLDQGPCTTPASTLLLSHVTRSLLWAICELTSVARIEHWEVNYCCF